MSVRHTRLSPSAPGSCEDRHTAPFKERLQRGWRWLVCVAFPPTPPGSSDPPHLPHAFQSQHFDGFVVEVWSQLLGQKHV